MTWKSSESAIDFNGDGVIDEADYAYYLGFQAWRGSDEAKDFNGDRKIGVEDYRLYLAYTAWLKTDDSMDYNGDKKIDFDDFTLYNAFIEWLNSEDALDIDGDQKITFDDYEIFISDEYKSYIEWVNSDKAVDYDGSGAIDELDYAIYQAYLAWKDSDEAADINKDRLIDYADYYAFLNPEISAYDLWRMSGNAADYNDDGKIDELDFTTFDLIGSYMITDYTLSGYDVYSLDTKLELTDVVQYLDRITFTFDGKQMKINFDETLSAEIKEKDRLLMKDIIEKGVVAVPSTSLMTFTITVPFRSGILEDVDVTLYFDLTKPKMETSFSLSHGNNPESTYKTFIYFALTKVTQA